MTTETVVRLKKCPEASAILVAAANGDEVAAAALYDYFAAVQVDPYTDPAAVVAHVAVPDLDGVVRHLRVNWVMYGRLVVHLTGTAARPTPERPGIRLRRPAWGGYSHRDCFTAADFIKAVREAAACLAAGGSADVRG
ncbi:MAG: hypothetical protein ACRC7O_06245 [Fimbriiglobus sp.]